MTEHQVAVARVQRAVAQFAERDRGALGKRDGAPGARGLRIAELASDEGGDHADAARVEVDVAPAQPKELTLAESRHRGSQVERGLDAAERIVGVWDREQLLELILIEELDPRPALTKQAAQLALPAPALAALFITTHTNGEVWVMAEPVAAVGL